MTTDEAVQYFGTQAALAAALQLRAPSSVSEWGRVPPVLRQLELEALTRGALQAEPECDRYRVHVRGRK